MVMGTFGVSYEKQNYVSVLRPSLLSCPFTPATGSKTHSHYEDFKGRAGGQNENHSSSCMRLSLGTGQSSPCWHKAGRKLNYPVHVQWELPSQTLSASQRADSRQSLWSRHDSWQVAYCYYYYSTLACKHDPEQEANMSRNNWLPSQHGFKFARRTISETGKQRQGSPKTNGKYLWRGRCSKDTDTNVKCLGYAETVTVEEKFSRINSRSGDVFYCVQHNIKNPNKVKHTIF